MSVSMLKRFNLVFLLMLVGLEVFAQADVYSPYSVFGVGQVVDKSMNVKLKGMGDVANAMYGGGLINAGNPASYAKIDSLAFLFDAGFYMKTSRFSTTALSEQSSNASFDHVFMSFGLTQWWKMALGVQPYSMQEYNMIVNSSDPEVGNYATAFQGSGGLNQAVIGNAFKLGKHFSIGANVNYVFGDTESLTTLYFPDSLYKISARRGVDLMVSSFKFDYGLLYTTQIGKDYGLSVGVTYDQSVKLRGKQTQFFRTIAGDIGTSSEYFIDTIVDTTFNSKLTMPQGFGVGVMFQKNNRWSIAADFDWMQWSRFARGEDVPGSLSDAWRVTVGGEYTPVHTSISNYFRRITYRAGGFYEHTYMNLRGHTLKKMGISFGASMPFPKSLSKVNVALEAGRCGTKEDGLVQEGYLKLDVGVSLFEHWFMKRKYK